eukprot:2530224-Amphidinium_carterae.1
MAGTRALDILEKQVAIDFFQDQYHWHHRVLLLPAGQGKWIVCTPDHEVQFQDLTEHRVIALPRGAVVPSRIVDSFYTFDPFQDGELDRIRAEARSLAEILGVAVPAQSLALSRWVIADTAHERFGQE